MFNLTLTSMTTSNSPAPSSLEFASRAPSHLITSTSISFFHPCSTSTASYSFFPCYYSTGRVCKFLHHPYFTFSLSGTAPINTFYLVLLHPKALFYRNTFFLPLFFFFTCPFLPSCLIFLRPLLFGFYVIFSLSFTLVFFHIP